MSYKRIIPFSHARHIRARAAARPAPVVISAPKNTARAGIQLGVTAAQFAQAYKSAQAGKPAQLFGILEHFMAIDDEIPASMDSLISSVLAEEYRVIPTEESVESERQARFFNDLFRELDLTSIAESLLEGRYYGMRAAMPVWGTMPFEGAAIQCPMTYELLPLRWLYAARPAGQNRANAGHDAGHTIMHIGDRQYHEVSRDLLFYSENKLPSYEDIDFTKFGVGLGCLRFAIMKYYQFEDWPAMNEVFATPMVIGQLSEGWRPEDKALLETAVFNMGNMSRAVLPPHSKIEMPKADTNGSDSYDKLITLINRVIAVKIKSESQTDNMNKHGSNAAMVTADGVKVRLATGMLSKLKRMITRRLMKPVADMNWNGRLLADLVWEVPRPDTSQADLTIDKGLYNMGVALSAKELRRRYKRAAPDPNDADDVVERGAAGIFGGF